MGGKKKLTLKQMERTEEKKDDAPKHGGKTTATMAERKVPGIMPPDLKSDKIVGEVKKMKAVTPYAIASRFNLRLSVARDVLEELTRRGVLDYVSGNKNLKIYKPHD